MVETEGAPRKRSRELTTTASRHYGGSMRQINMETVSTGPQVSSWLLVKDVGR